MKEQKKQIPCEEHGRRTDENDVVALQHGGQGMESGEFRHLGEFSALKDNCGSFPRKVNLLV